MVFDLSDIKNTLVAIAGAYVGLLHDNANSKDVKSSGDMIENIKPTKVETTDTGYSIGITAPDYATYQDEGVNGWKVDRATCWESRSSGRKISLWNCIWWLYS